MYKVNAPCVLLSVLLFLLMGEARAFTCITSDGGVIGAGGSEEPLPVRIRVSPNLVDGKNSIVNVSQIYCKNDLPGNYIWTDYLYFKAVSVRKADLYPLTLGITINGNDFDIPGNMLSLKNLEYLFQVVSGGKRNVPINMYIKMNKRPSRDVVIKKGDVIAKIDMWQVNNQVGCPECGPYNWLLIADNDAYFATTTCTINGAKQMNIDFGPISQDNFTTGVESAVIKQNHNLDYYCEDSNASQDIAVRLVGNASGFSSEVIKTSNENIGIAMVYKGKVVKPNEIFNSKVVNGIGSDTLTFVPIKKNVPFNEINTGPFTGSATLVFSVP